MLDRVIKWNNLLKFIDRASNPVLVLCQNLIQFPSPILLIMPSLNQFPFGASKQNFWKPLHHTDACLLCDPLTVSF